MKNGKLNFLSFILKLAIPATLMLTACDKDEKPEDSRLYNFTVTKSNSSLENAEVIIQTINERYSATTDNEGKCKIAIPNDVDLPSYVIATIDHSSIQPSALTVSGSIDSESNKNVNCVNAPSKVLIKDVSLYHLGDDNYGGSENSQLQIPAQGTQKTFGFYLSSIPTSMPRLKIYARGIQYQTEIIFNGITTDRLNDSAANGDLSRWDFNITANPSTVLNVGYNTFTIKTGKNTSSDWDDIEFCALSLYYP